MKNALFDPFKIEYKIQILLTSCFSVVQRSQTYASCNFNARVWLPDKSQSLIHKYCFQNLIVGGVFDLNETGATGIRTKHTHNSVDYCVAMRFSQ